MASSGIDFSKLTPSNGAVTDLRQLIFLALSDVESIGGELNFIPGQVNGKKVGFIGEFGMLGKASTGCDPTYGNDLIATSEQTWDIAEWAIAEGICYKDLEPILLQSALKTKTAKDDLTGTIYIDEILAPRLERAIKKAVRRIAWFGDKSATAYSSSNTSGTLKEGVDAGYFTLTDGYWKRFFDKVAAGKINRVTVSANAATTTAAQKTAAKASGYMTGVVEDMLLAAPAVLRQQSGLRIYMTQAMADALTVDYRHTNVGSELQWKSLQEGIKTVEFAGAEIWAMPAWDEIIQTALQNTTNKNAEAQPFRAVLTIHDNLLIGSESEDELEDIEIFFNQKDRKNYIYAKDTLGTIIAQDDLAVVAY